MLIIVAYRKSHPPYCALFSGCEKGRQKLPSGIFSFGPHCWSEHNRQHYYIVVNIVVVVWYNLECIAIGTFILCIWPYRCWYGHDARRICTPYMPVYCIRHSSEYRFRQKHLSTHIGQYIVNNFSHFYSVNDSVIHVQRDRKIWYGQKGERVLCLDLWLMLQPTDTTGKKQRTIRSGCELGRFIQREKEMKVV